MRIFPIYLQFGIAEEVFARISSGAAKFRAQHAVVPKQPAAGGARFDACEEPDCTGQ
jgi:hypothetical protein